LHKRFPEIPPNTQVGFANWYYSNPDGTWSYAGLVFRSRIVFDFSEFKNLKGYYSEAKLLIKQNEGGNSQFIDPADCDVRVYVLEQAWPGGDFFNTYGNHLIQNFPNGIPNDFDIPDWATAWTNGTSFNAGLLLVMAMEKMNHDKLFAIRRYEILLKVQFQEN
jgi:hypothetical protein